MQHQFKSTILVFSLILVSSELSPPSQLTTTLLELIIRGRKIFAFREIEQSRKVITVKYVSSSYREKLNRIFAVFIWSCLYM